MKKFYYLPIALAATALTACSSDDDVSVKNGGTNKYGDQIVFSTGVAGSTRAATTYANVAAITSFQVAAVDGSDNVYFPYAEATTTDGTVTTSSVFTPAGAPQWIDGTLGFYAYAPTTGVTASFGTKGATATKTLTFAQTETNADNAGHVDLIVAYNTGTRSSNPVKLDFKHALSKIILKAKTGSTDDYTVKVTGAKVGFVYSTGTMTYQTTASGENNPTWAAGLYPSWGSQATEKSYTTTVSEATLGTSDATALGEVYVVPQTTASAWNGAASTTAITTGAYLAVNCTITRKSDSQVIYTGYSAVKFASAPTWEPGKAYTYTINFFTSGGGGGQVDPINTPDGGQDIIAPITFTISISDWVDGGSTDIKTK